MNTPPGSSDSLRSFTDGVASRVDRTGTWLPAVVQSDGTVQHEGEEITAEELSRRWSEDAPPGGLKAIDFRPPDSTE